jgi:hypothetical protein
LILNLIEEVLFDGGLATGIDVKTVTGSPPVTAFERSA